MERNLNKMMLSLLVVCIFSLAGCGSGGDSGGGSTHTAVLGDFTGTWSGSSGGTALIFSFIQTGNNLAITRTTPAQPSAIKYDGLVTGNSAVVTTYASNLPMATTTWTMLDSTTISAVLNTCVPTAGYTCGVPIGDTIVFKR
jgi:hypothetical protein